MRFAKFIIEGILTCIIAGVGWFLLVPFPDDHPEKSWNFLTEREVAWVIARVEADRADTVTEPFNLVKFLKPASDPKVWGFALIFCCLTTITYALAYFLPIILRLGMGFDVGKSQCLVTPPYAFAAIVMFICGWAGDKYKIRGPILIFNAIMCIAGLALIGWSGVLGVRYFGVFLTCAGANANIPICMSYQGNNIRGQWKRAFCSATLVGFGGIGGIAGSLVFRTQDAPDYRPGLWACMTACLVIICTVLALDSWFWISNRRAKRGEVVLEGDVSGICHDSISSKYLLTCLPGLISIHTLNRWPFSICYQTCIVTSKKSEAVPALPHQTCPQALDSWPGVSGFDLPDHRFQCTSPTSFTRLVVWDYTYIYLQPSERTRSASYSAPQKTTL